MNTLQILIEARKLIEKPENWTRRNYAQNEFGQGVTTISPAACKFCAVGALKRVTADSWEHSHLAWDMLDKAVGQSITNFNDTHTHAEVLDAFSRAIESARATEVQT